ncbi:hypothetical protein [Paraflavitalea speifideaquila]|uniref:hypothetical protein n=1 Tax=Paraflavitalea speifideaquila TaxID=3076558 RepID=UPI0028EE998F|nr:hypothetical protein [Paraflavitalea speifideiaquila]
MKKLLTVTVLVAIIMLSGCLSAVHPLLRKRTWNLTPSWWVRGRRMGLMRFTLFNRERLKVLKGFRKR